MVYSTVGSGEVDVRRFLCRLSASAAAVAALAERVRASAASAAAGASPASALYTFPSIILSALVIGWAAEAAQFLVSQGLALAILAWLQTLPEYAVEFVIALEAGKDPTKAHLMIANLTGSLRLLVGLGWPMIYFVRAFSRRLPAHRGKAYARSSVRLDPEHAVEIMFLIPAVFYFFFIWLKGVFAIYDSAVLLAFYVGYLVALRKVPPQEEETEGVDPIPRRILALRPALRNASIAALFVVGGGILYFMAHPFLESMLALAVSLGVSQFVFIQWVAPFLSEFPEKLTAFNWARRVRFAPMAVMNLVSSNFNQWTVLAATLPIVYSISAGRVMAIHFDPLQRAEVLLTLSQTCVGLVVLANMELSRWEAAGIFAVWFVQFVWSESRHYVTAINFIWASAAAAHTLRVHGRRMPVWVHFRRIVLGRDD